MPSEQYGVPEQYDALSNQGYDYARGALDESLNEVRLLSFVVSLVFSLTP